MVAWGKPLWAPPQEWGTNPISPRQGRDRVAPLPGRNERGRALEPGVQSHPRLPSGYLFEVQLPVILALMSSNPQVHQARDPNSSAICSRSQSVNPLTPGFLILHKESLFDGDFPPNGSLSGCSTLPSLEVRGGSMTLLWDQLASLIELTK